MRRVLPVLLLTSCAQFNWAVEKAQSLVVHPVTPQAIAVATDTRCDDQPTTYTEAKAAITVPIVETKITKGKQTALPWVMLVAKGFSKEPAELQLLKMRHELVHYCQRKTFAGFDQLWLTGYVDDPRQIPRSDYRAAFEAAAYRVSHGNVHDNFVDAYLLHDLDKRSLERMLGEALGQ